MPKSGRAENGRNSSKSSFGHATRGVGYASLPCMDNPNHRFLSVRSGRRIRISISCTKASNMPEHNGTHSSDSTTTRSLRIALPWLHPRARPSIGSPSARQRKRLQEAERSACGATDMQPRPYRESRIYLPTKRAGSRPQESKETTNSRGY